MISLSRHFSLDELTLSQTAERNHIDNHPPQAVITNLYRTAEGLELVREALGNNPLSISSGYRSPDLNRRIGGAANSQHVEGKAADFTCPAFGTPRQIATALKKTGIKFDQLILEYDRWVHISFVAKNPRGQTLITDRAGTRPF